MMKSIGHLSRLEIVMVLRKCARQKSLNPVFTAVVFTFLCIGLILPSETSAQGFFGPKDYDDCILQNMRGITSDTAAGLVHRSCLSKFPKEELKVQNNFDAKGDSWKPTVCEVFWDGKKFTKSFVQGSNYKYQAQQYGVTFANLFLTREMMEYFEKQGSKFDLSNQQDPFSDFFFRQLSDIQYLCR